MTKCNLIILDTATHCRLEHAVVSVVVVCYRYFIVHIQLDYSLLMRHPMGQDQLKPMLPTLGLLVQIKTDKFNNLISNVSCVSEMNLENG